MIARTSLSRFMIPIVAATCLLALAALTIAALTTGEVSMSAATALAAAVGFGDRGDVFVVQEFRAPRLVAGVIAGAGLAAAGAVLQRLFRNPLASPDVIGVTGGASFGAVIVLAAGASQSAIPLAALAGGMFAALALGAIGWKSQLSTARLVLVGLAIQAGLAAAVNLVIVRFPKELAGSAMRWTAGSLYGRTWPEVSGAAIGCVLVMVLLYAQYRTLAVLDLGDDSAGALGIGVDSARLRLLITAVAMAALAVAISGPIVFVALAVPQIVRLLCGPPTPVTLAVTALAGASLLVAADFTAQHLLPVHGLPVGVVTTTVGAPWLLWLLVRDSSPATRRTT
ncbi:iron complex transport system permease protein [Nocardia fluminea]|uniref:Iron complex transport system permease protein n=2 Tax=Nocardiaceae TaxID=85025 RepID=A0A2N3VH97_9NOCA|nr:iron complex transport system permease protein [Nocardia fluminea]